MLATGGLHVVGIECHESKHIDNQVPRGPPFPQGLPFLLTAPWLQVIHLVSNAMPLFNSCGLYGPEVSLQLHGHSGHQGDPGSSRFFLSLEDNIFRIFGGDRIQVISSHSSIVKVKESERDCAMLAWV